MAVKRKHSYFTTFQTIIRNKWMLIGRISHEMEQLLVFL